MTRDELIAFERDIADAWEAKGIRAPVHLAGGNEDYLIDIFGQIKPQDWIFGQWRSHYHCLLKGVPPDRLKADILAGNSIHLCYPEYNIVSSAIAGQVASWAVGTAEAIQMLSEDATVWCFVGDMTCQMGVFYEALSYGFGRRLPIMFVIEDNGLSVGTPTSEAWPQVDDRLVDSCIYNYEYKLPWPHSGSTGQRINF